MFEPVLAGGELPGAEVFAGAAAGARAVLGDEPGPQATLDASFASLHALYWLTANLASRAPLLVCVDDLVWCDEASLRFLEFLVRRLEGLAVAVVLAFRTDESGSSDVVDAFASHALARVVQPAPLGHAAVAAMLAMELSEEVDASFCTACIHATGGNPLLVAELLRALRAEGVPPRASEVARVRAIGAVAVGPAVRRRLGMLGERARAVAQAVAILGESVPRNDIAGTAALSAVELEDVLAALAQAGIVRSEVQVSFVHPLVADAVRVSLRASERARLHERAVRTMSARGASALELAPHVVAGAVGTHPDAVELLCEAARWAQSAGAPEAAVIYLDRAVAELRDGADGAHLLLDLGRAKLQAGEPSAPDELRRAIELARDARTRAIARIALSVALFAAGGAVRAIDVLVAGIDETAEQNPDVAQRMRDELLANIQLAGPGLVHFPKSVGEHISRARVASHASGALSGRLALCSLAHEELVGGGTAPDIVALADEGLAGGEVLAAEGPACLPFYLAVAALIFCDELERVVALLTVALDAACRLGSLTGFVWGSVWRAYANLRSGRLIDAEADARAALESGNQYLAGPGTTSGIVWLAGSLTDQGRLDEALDLHRKVPEPDPPSAITLTLLEGRARLRLAREEYRAAARDLELYHTLDAPTTRLVAGRSPALGPVNHRSLWARALISLGDADGARALVEEELPLAEALGTHRAIGMTLHTAGLLEHGEARIQILQRASQELGRSQSRLEYADALYDYGAALRRANRRLQARAPLRAALAIARDARAEPLRDRAAEELKATGARVSRPGASGVDALTASEHRIASMAAAGVSNRDIAQALFVTVKTVETHLGHAYNKLNLTGRTQLAEALGDRETLR